MSQTDEKIYHVLGLKELTLLKRSYFPRQPTDSIPIKIPMAFFTELEQIISIFVWKQS